MKRKDNRRTYNEMTKSARHGLFCLGLLTLSLLAVTSACTDEDKGAPAPVDFSDVPISFSTDVIEPQTTRATSGTIDDLDALKALPEGFGVMGYLTDEDSWGKWGLWDSWGPEDPEDAPTPDFMYNQQVRWGALYTTTDEKGKAVNVEDWIYAPAKYWPNATNNAAARYISFFAYAPFTEILNSDGSTGQAAGITKLTNKDDKRPFLIYQLDEAAGSVQTDVLWAEPCIDATRNGNGLIYFKDSKEIWQKVPLSFHHALAAVEVYVQRVYDEPTSSGKRPEAEQHTKLFVSRLRFEATNSAASGLYSSGRINLKTGRWDLWDSWSPGGVFDDTQEKTLKALTYSETIFNNTVRGTTSETPGAIRENELNKWAEGGTYDSETKKWTWDPKSDFGVDEEERLLFADKAITLLPSGGSITITPTLTYSMITRDDELLLSTLTDKDGHKYSRIVNTVTGNPLTLTLEAGKKYKLVIRIGVEHVEFEVVSVVDWDFPMRFNPAIGSDFKNETIDHTLNED